MYFRSYCTAVKHRKSQTKLLAKSKFSSTSLRQILKIFWPQTISNEELLRITNFEVMVVLIKLKRQVLDWNRQGSRRPGRPAETS